MSLSDEVRKLDCRLRLNDWGVELHCRYVSAPSHDPVSDHRPRGRNEESKERDSDYTIEQQPD